jgi:hypothetical protein
MGHYRNRCNAPLGARTGNRSNSRHPTIGTGLGDVMIAGMFAISAGPVRAFLYRLRKLQNG